MALVKNWRQHARSEALPEVYGKKADEDGSVQKWDDRETRKSEMQDLESEGPEEVEPEVPEVEEGPKLGDAYRRAKRSPYLLTLKMLMESTNLVSSMLYTVEAFQRSRLEPLTASCGGSALASRPKLRLSHVQVPVQSFECPVDPSSLSECGPDISMQLFCEADVGAVGSCDLQDELDNCGDFDVYRR